MLQLYETDYEALTGFVKDFIRNAIFPKVSSLVPSSTRDGAAAFLKSIRRPPDLFEYEHTDLGSLNEIWHEYALGSISMVEAARRSASIVRSTVQVLEPANASTVEEVLSDVVANDKLLAGVELEDELTALPAITRPEVESDAKLLLVPAEEEPLRGYRGFLALTDRVRREYTDFFCSLIERRSFGVGRRRCIFFSTILENLAYTTTCKAPSYYLVGQAVFGFPHLPSS